MVAHGRRFAHMRPTRARRWRRWRRWRRLKVDASDGGSVQAAVDAERENGPTAPRLSALSARVRDDVGRDQLLSHRHLSAARSTWRAENADSHSAYGAPSAPHLRRQNP